MSWISSSRLNRRGFFGLLAGFLLAPFAKAPEPTLNEMNQFLWKKHWDNVSRGINEGRIYYHPSQKTLVAEHFADDLERAYLGLV